MHWLPNWAWYVTWTYKPSIVRTPDGVVVEDAPAITFTDTTASELVSGCPDAAAAHPPAKFVMNTLKSDPFPIDSVVEIASCAEKLIPLTEADPVLAGADVPLLHAHRPMTVAPTPQAFLTCMTISSHSL
jgi:hypothetical protein